MLLQSGTMTRHRVQYRVQKFRPHDVLTCTSTSTGVALRMHKKNTRKLSPPYGCVATAVHYVHHYLVRCTTSVQQYRVETRVRVYSSQYSSSIDIYYEYLHLVFVATAVEIYYRFLFRQRRIHSCLCTSKNNLKQSQSHRCALRNIITLYQGHVRTIEKKEEQK